MYTHNSSRACFTGKAKSITVDTSNAAVLSCENLGLVNNNDDVRTTDRSACGRRSA